MKKIFLIIVLIFSMNVFAFDENKFTWHTFQELEMYKDKLEPFDLVVLNVGSEISQTFGHIFIVNEEKKLVEIKGAIEVFADSPIYTFFHINNRNVSVLRYKYIDEELRKAISSEIPNHYNKFYSILTGTDSEDINSYCSKFVYNLYEEAGKKLGREIKLFPDKWPIMPFDFFKTDLLVNVNLLN